MHADPTADIGPEREKGAEEFLEAVKDRLEEGRLEEVGSLLGELPAADVAVLLGELAEQQQAAAFRVLTVEAQAEVLGELDKGTVRALADSVPRRVQAAVEQMEPDEVVDVLEVLPQEQAEALLERFPEEQAATAERLLTYPPDSAGGLMTTEFVLLHGSLTAREAIQVTQRSREAETVADLFVAGEADVLRGHLPLHRLVFAPPEALVGELMEEIPVEVTPDTDQEDLVRAATRYDLHVIPVVDGAGRMVGVVTVDDILEAAEQEMDEDMYRLAGTGERDPVHASVYRSTRLRLPWLLLSVLDGLFIAFVVSRFVDERWVMELSFFLPLIPLMGGQVAIQGSTIMVRGLALGTIRRSRVVRFLGKQFVITALLAIACALAAGVLGALVVGAGASTMLAVGLAVGVAIVFAGMLGMIFPLAFNAVGIDPAVSSGPFITMLNDLFCICVYLALGTLLAPTSG
ncbi:MAG: magnesium transporter [Candidatus Brocadiaceae bacterium]